jgi:predicted ATPase
VPGGFFSAETFRDRADFLDDVSLVDPGQMKYYGGRTLTDQSHGEGLLTYFAGRYRYRGIYYVDEPESALSPRSQVAFLRLLSEYSAGRQAQFLIATHSPILMALPGAQITLFSRDEVREATYQETDHYRLYREFILDPVRFLENPEFLESPEG